MSSKKKSLKTVSICSQLVTFVDHEGSECQVSLVSLVSALATPFIKKSSSPLKNALGTASNHALTFLLEDRNTLGDILGQLKPDPCFLLGKQKEKFSPQNTAQPSLCTPYPSSYVFERAEE